jgi:hypothetical protein
MTPIPPKESTPSSVSTSRTRPADGSTFVNADPGSDAVPLDSADNSHSPHSADNSHSPHSADNPDSDDADNPDSDDLSSASVHSKSASQGPPETRGSQSLEQGFEKRSHVVST